MRYDMDAESIRVYLYRTNNIKKNERVIILKFMFTNPENPAPRVHTILFDGCMHKALCELPYNK